MKVRFHHSVEPEVKKELAKVAETPNLKVQLNDWEFFVKRSAFESSRPAIRAKKCKIISSSKVMVPGPLRTIDVLSDEVVK